MKINIAVCDDEEIIRKQMSNIIIDYFSQKTYKLNFGNLKMDILF